MYFSQKNCFFPIFDFPADIYLFIIKNGNARTMCEIYSKLAIKTPELRQVLERIRKIRKISIVLSGILQKSKMPSVEYRHLEVPYVQIRFSKKQISSQTLLFLMSHSVCPMVCLSSGF